LGRRGAAEETERQEIDRVADRPDVGVAVHVARRGARRTRGAEEVVAEQEDRVGDPREGAVAVAVAVEERAHAADGDLDRDLEARLAVSRLAVANDNAKHVRARLRESNVRRGAGRARKLDRLRSRYRAPKIGERIRALVEPGVGLDLETGDLGDPTGDGDLDRRKLAVGEDVDAISTRGVQVGDARDLRRLVDAEAFLDPKEDLVGVARALLLAVIDREPEDVVADFEEGDLDVSEGLRLGGNRRRARERLVDDLPEVGELLAPSVAIGRFPAAKDGPPGDARHVTVGADE